MTSNYNNMNAPGADRNVVSGYNDPEGTHGPHQSRVGNTLDPRVDSDRDNVRGPAPAGVPASDRNVMTGYNDPEGTHGPHQSRAANAMDPRVDSDRDGRAAPTAGMGSTTQGYDNSNLGSTSGEFGSSRTAGAGEFGSSTMGGTARSGGEYGSATSTGYGYGSTNRGPHDSNVANKMDPRVDSDRANVGTAAAPGSDRNVVTGYNDPEGTHGPHQSRAANAMDPRVDSDRDNVAATGATGAATGRPVGTTASTGTQTTATTGGENVPAGSQNGKRGGLFETVKGRAAQAHGVGENVRGQFNAAMGELFHDKKGQAKGEATAVGGQREFANKEFERKGTLDKAL